jgi:hypothetical protein
VTPVSRDPRASSRPLPNSATTHRSLTKMSRTHLACLAAVALAVALGVHYGGRTGLGVVAGALLAGGVGLIGHRLLATSLRSDFEASLRALLASIGLKLLVLVVAWAALAFVPSLGAVAAPSALVVSYAATALLLAAVGSFDHLRSLADATPAARASITETGDILP